MATRAEEAEKAFRLAEERFLDGDLDGALRMARNAKRHSASLPALQSALTAYEVHVAERRVGRNCWYAVLSVGVGGGHPEPVTHDHDAIKKRYKRLCLVLHPDKNRSAAADGAFKLLQRAWEVLSARHPPETVPNPGPVPGRKPRPPPPGPPDPDPDDWWYAWYFRHKPRRPPPPFSSASSVNFNAWRAKYARKRGTAYCGHCSSESASAAAGGHSGTPGGRCHSCGTPFDPPRQSQAEGASDPPPAGTAAEQPPRDPPPRQSTAEGASAPPPAGTAAEPPPRDPPPPPRRRQRDDGEKKFTCPTECCRCKTPFSSLVSPGMCKLTCQACSYDAFVYPRLGHRFLKFLLLLFRHLVALQRYGTVHACISCRYGAAG